MASVSRDNILQLLKDRGPMVPNDIKKILGGDTIILGAMLAELSSRKLVSITHAKRGGSPFYYIPDKPESLEMCFKYLSDQEQNILDLLQKEKVIQDNTLEVFQRAALRQLKDFAKEFKANTTNGPILFWRYYLVSDEEAVAILNNRYAPKEDVSQQTIQEIPESKNRSVQEEVSESVAEKNYSTSTTKPESHEEFSSKQDINVEEVDDVEETLKTTPIVEEEKEPEFEEETIPERKAIPKEEQSKEHLEKEESDENSTITDSEKNNDEEFAKEETQDALTITEPSLEEAPFYLHILKFFDEHNIKIIKEEQLSKDREYEFLVRVPTAIGPTTMLARAKNKKRLNESDVAPALLRAKSKDLFCLYLTPGDFTKKSQELITKEYTGLIQKQLPEM